MRQRWGCARTMVSGLKVRLAATAAATDTPALIRVRRLIPDRSSPVSAVPVPSAAPAAADGRVPPVSGSLNPSPPTVSFLSTFRPPPTRRYFQSGTGTGGPTARTGTHPEPVGLQRPCPPVSVIQYTVIIPFH